MTLGSLFRFQRQLCVKYGKVEAASSLYTLTSNYSTAPSSATPVHAFFRHCDRATTEPVAGEIQGHIPEWLEGTLFRNGPGLMHVGNDHYKHIFDGLALLHKYEIRNGKATYTSRPLESDSYKKNMKANRIVVSEFGTTAFPDPCKSIFQRLQSTFKGADIGATDNCNVNVGFFGDRLYAMTETNFIRQIDPTDLKVIGPKTPLHNYVAVQQATAHPHILKDGTVLNMGNNYRSKSGAHYCVVKFPPNFNKENGLEGAKVVAEIPFTSSTFPAYYHSFGMTQDKIIFIETPLRLDLFKLAKAGLFGSSSFAECMTWFPDRKAKIHVVSLSDGKRHPFVYETDPFFTFHHINAYEEDGQIVLDVAGYDRGEIVPLWDEKNNQAAPSKKPAENEATARRFVLPLNLPVDGKHGENLVTLKYTTAKASSYLGDKPNRPSYGKVKVFCEPQHLTTDWVELPRINYDYNGQKYSYFYAVSSVTPPDHTSPEADSIVKVNIDKNESIRWKDPAMIPSEPVFVRNPKGTAEDDGIVVSALMHRNQETAVTLLFLNAKTFQEQARVKFNTAGTFTSTFHGLWATDGAKVHHY